MTEKQSYRDADDMPTERAVLEREWKAMRLALSTPRAAVQAAQPEAVGLTDNDLERIFEDAGGKWNGDMWTIEDADFHPAMRSLLASAPTPEPMSAPTAEADERSAFEAELRKQCFQKPTPEAYDLAWSMWKARALSTPQSAATPEPSDAERLDWLEQNLFHVEPDEWTRTHQPHLNTWRIFSPKGVQGSARTIIDAAMRATKGGKL